MDQDLKRFLISSAITFVSTFGVIFAAAVQVDSFTFTQEALVSLTIAAGNAGVRAVAKVVVEFLTGFNK
jgi:hypothetical protein